MKQYEIQRCQGLRALQHCHTDEPRRPAFCFAANHSKRNELRGSPPSADVRLRERSEVLPMACLFTLPTPSLGSKSKTTVIQGATVKLRQDSIRTNVSWSLWCKGKQKPRLARIMAYAAPHGQPASLSAAQAQHMQACVRLLSVSIKQFIYT